VLAFVVFVPGAPTRSSIALFHHDFLFFWFLISLFVSSFCSVYALRPCTRTMHCPLTYAFHSLHAFLYSQCLSFFYVHMYASAL